MAKCEYCGKDVSFGIKVSHSHRRSNRTWKPNIKRVKAIVNGSPKRVYACTRCFAPAKLHALSDDRTDIHGTVLNGAVIFCLFIFTLRHLFGRA